MAVRKLETQLSLTGLQGVTRGLDSVADKLLKIHRLAGQMGQGAGTDTLMPSWPQSGNNQATQLARALKPTLTRPQSQSTAVQKLASGPFQAHELAKQQVELAHRSGSPMQIADAQLNLMRRQQAAQRAMKALTPKTQQGFGSKAMDALMSSRVGKEGLMPLVSKIAGLLGPVGMAISVGVGIGVAALKTFADECIEAARRLNSFAQAQFTAGGTGRETAQMGALGGALGMSPQSMAQLSRGIAETTAGGGMPSAIAARAGIMDRPGFFGKVDKSENLLKLIDYLGTLSSDDAIRAARELGAEALLPLRNLSQGTRDKLTRDAGVSAAVNDPASEKNAAELTTSLGRVTAAFEDLLTSALEPWIPGLTHAFNWLADELRNMTVGMLDFNNIIYHLNKLLGPLGLKNEDGTPVGLSDEDLGKKMADLMKPAVDRHVEALDRNTVALNKNRSFYGGGDRARGAIPPAARYDRIADQAARGMFLPHAM
jgi:hypothetical protein